MFLPIKQSLFTVISVIFVVSGIVLEIFWKDVYHSILAKQMALNSESENFHIWQKPDFDIMFDIYLFNWTNPSDLNVNNYIKPKLEQLGPYRFRESHEKTGIKWHPHNHTISFKRNGTYHFDEEGSKGRLDDKIISINAFAATIANLAKDFSKIKKGAINLALLAFNPKAYIVKQARELLFEGYTDELIKAIRIGQGIGINVNMPFDRFGYFYTRNNSGEFLGHFNVNTGQDDIEKLGLMRTWNYKNASGYFDSPCDTIRGSSGELFAPSLSKSQSIAMFNGDLCRHIDLYYETEMEINGITTYKYVSNERSLENGTIYSENKCFGNGKNYPSGVSDASGCRWELPMVASHPHFYAADPSLLNHVDGLNPIKQEHEIFIAVEPQTGTPINLVGRLQYSAAIEPAMGITPFKNTPRIFFPVLWVEQSLYVPNNITDKLKFVTWIPAIGYTVFGVLILIGISIIMCTFLCKCCK